MRRYPSVGVITMRLPDSVSIFTAEIWAMIKALVLSCVMSTIDHNNLTQSYTLKKNLTPQCEHCQCMLTVRHILWSATILLKKGKIYLVRVLVL